MRIKNGAFDDNKAARKADPVNVKIVSFLEGQEAGVRAVGFDEIRSELGGDGVGLLDGEIHQAVIDAGLSVEI